MWNRKRSVKLSIAVCFALCAILTVALFIGPWFVEIWFSRFRGWDVSGYGMMRMIALFIACFYPCAALGYMTLYSLLRLLFNIKNDKIFISPNVKYLRRISWCCVVVSAITLIAGALYIPYLFVSVAAGFVGLMLRVVKNVMQSAVEIQTENELTI